MTVTPPMNLEAEESVLGAILLAGKIPNDVLEKVSPTHFYRQSHGDIYNAALTLHTQGKPVSLVSVHDQLDKMGKLEAVGGVPRLSELAALTPSTSNAAHYAEIVVEQKALRDLIRVGQEIQQLGQDRPGDIEELRMKAENLLHAATSGTTTRSAVPITEGLDELIDSIRDAYATGIAKTGVPTGFNSLDSMLHGFWPAQLILLAARTGVGKSTFGQNIAENISDEGWAVLFASLEMSRYELQIRSLARAGRIDGDRLATGQITTEEANRLGPAINIVKNRTNLLIQDDGLASPQTLAAVARRHNEVSPLGLIVVDYIGLMQGEGQNKYEQVSSVSRSLKMLAQNTKVPILALAQMNRAQDSRSDKRPMLSDLRDSGSLEQDADVVMFLHRESDHDPDKQADGSIEVIVAKNRKGKTGTAVMSFAERYSRFLEPGGQT